MKLGLIDVGGGMRGTFAAGILEYCLENNINFDCCIGLSAGSTNLVSFLAGQAGRNMRYYMEYAFRKDYSGLNCFLKTRNWLNLDYIYGTLANTGGEDPIDYKALKENPAELFVVAEEIETGATKYFTKEDFKQDNYSVLSASCNIPILNRPVVIDGKKYYDGGFANSLPIDKALEEGCDKVVVILTRPLHIPRKPNRDKVFASLLGLRFKKAAERLASRAKEYNEKVEYVKKLQEEGKVLILSPEEVYGLDTLTRNKEAMMKLYEDGRKAAEKIPEWIKEKTNNAKTKIESKKEEIKIKAHEKAEEIKSKVDEQVEKIKSKKNSKK